MSKLYIHLGSNPVFLQGQVTLHHEAMKPEPKPCLITISAKTRVEFTLSDRRTRHFLQVGFHKFAKSINGKQEKINAISSPAARPTCSPVTRPACSLVN